jgi:predicted acylesterase/phospholipase RssA
MNKITHLVLSGGGMYGVMYIGILRYMYLENLHKDVKYISAASIGTFIGLMLAFKLTIVEMESVMYSVFSNQDFTFIPRKRYLQLLSDNGLCTTRYIVDKLINVLKDKYKNIENIEDFSFENMAKTFGINLYMSVTNINKCKNEILSIESTPTVSVFKACEASMSIPILYKPVIINDNYYYDGGITNNFPIKIFKDVPYENIIGIILDNMCDENNFEEKPGQKMSFMKILKQLMNIANILRRKESLYKQIHNDNKIPFLITDNIPKNIDFLKMKINNEGILMNITTDEINQMIYAGFDIMYRYIQKRSEIISEETKKRLIDLE